MLKMNKIQHCEIGYVNKQDGVILPAKNYLMCPTRIKSPWKLCNKFFIDHACSIKMAGHHFFLWIYGPLPRLTS